MEEGELEELEEIPSPDGVEESMGHGLRLKLVKLTARVHKLEECFAVVSRLTDKIVELNLKMDGLMVNNPKVNEEEEGIEATEEIINDIEAEPGAIIKEVVPHPEFTNEEGINQGENKAEITEKQSKALELINKGLTNREIAEELSISKVMAYKYRKRLTELKFIE